MGTGGIHPPPQDDREGLAAQCVSPAFVSWARQDKPRLFVDLSQGTECLKAIKFKREALTEFMSALVPNET